MSNLSKIIKRKELIMLKTNKQISRVLMSYLLANFNYSHGRHFEFLDNPLRLRSQAYLQ